jgi:hypothetical protein
MYALLGLLSIALLGVAIAASPGRRRGVALTALSLAALMTHYLAVVPVAAAAAALFWRERRPVALWPFAAAGLAWLPWLAYALPASFAHTSRTVAAVPPPENALVFAGTLLAFLPGGALTDISISFAAGLACALVLAALGWKGRGHIVVALWTSLLAAVAVYLAYPAFGRPRFFLPAVPLLLAAIAAVPARWIALGAAALLGLAQAAALPATYDFDRHSLEIEAERLAEATSRLGPNDTVVLHAWWQEGVIRLRNPAPPRIRWLQDLAPEEAVGSSETWLAMVGGAGRRDPAFPREFEIEQRQHRVDDFMIGGMRVVRFAAAAPAGLAKSLAVQGLQARVTPHAATVAAGGALPVEVEWTTVTGAADVVLFLHLVDEQGRRVAGRDGEPLDGLAKTSAGLTGLVDRRGLTAPLWAQPGRYTLRAGLYLRSDGTAVPVGGESAVEIASIEIVPPMRSATPTHSVGGAGLALLALQRPNPGAARVERYQTIDGVQSRTYPIDATLGERLGVVLQWTPVAPMPPLSVFVHLVDGSGRIVAQSDGEPAGGARPTTGWRAGEVIVEVRELVLPPGADLGNVEIRIGLYNSSGSRMLVSGRQAEGAAVVAELVAGRPKSGS